MVRLVRDPWPFVAGECKTEIAARQSTNCDYRWQLQWQMQVNQRAKV